MDYLWILWVALILAFVVIEMFSLELVFLMVAVGSVGGLVLALLGAPLWAQIVLTVVVSLLLILALRPALLRRLRRGGDPTLSNVDALIGLEGVVVVPVSAVAGSVKLANGETWTARADPASGATPMPLGSTVTVVAISGATALVAPRERIVAP